MSLLAAMPRKEAQRGECAQNDRHTVDSFSPCARLVASADRQSAGDQPANGEPIRPAAGADGSKCTSAPIEPGRLDADSKCTTAPIGSAPAAEPAACNPCFLVPAPAASRCARWREFILAKRRWGSLPRGFIKTCAASPVRRRSATTACGGSSSDWEHHGRCRFGGWNVSRERRRRSTSEPCADYNSRRKAPQDPRAAGDIVAFAQGL